MKLLGEPTVCGTPWKIYLTTAEETPEVLGRQGICVEAEQTIYINDDETPEDGIPFVAAHELAHASNFASGAKDTLRMLTGLKGKRLEDLEEFIVVSMFHAVYDTFVRNDWLDIRLG